MTIRHASSCLQASSTLTLFCSAKSNPHAKVAFHVRNGLLVRHYASQKPFRPSKDVPVLQPSTLRPDTAPVSLDDKINPPASTRPPPLNLPTRGSENVAYYYFRLGRAYGTFYKDGLKAVWRNHKAASALKKRIFDDLHAKGTEQAKNWRTVRDVAVAQGLLTRAEFQLLERNSYDIGKLPVFGVLVLIFGEWLPLLVPFMPSAVPGTCRIPKQIKGMREKAELRRRITFRSGVKEPARELVRLEDSRTGWPLAHSADVRQMLTKLRSDQLLHISTTLNLHSRIWDLVQLPPPAVLLRRKIASRFQYVALDDQLLDKYGGPKKLELDEMLTACDERGIDVLGREEEKLRGDLKLWIERQHREKGRGGAVMAMLFNR